MKVGDKDASLAFAEESFRHSWDMSDEHLIDGAWVAGLCCECGAFVPYGQEVAHIAAAFAPLIDRMGERTLREQAVRRVKAAPVTQREVARAAGFSEKHVSQMMTGHADGGLSAWQRLIDAAEDEWMRCDHCAFVTISAEEANAHEADNEHHWVGTIWPPTTAARIRAEIKNATTTEDA